MIKNDKNNIYKNVIVCVVLVCLTVLLFGFYFTGLQKCREQNLWSDTIDHIDAALSLGECLKNGLAGIKEFRETADYPHLAAYPVWHIMVYLIHRIICLMIPGITVETSANIGAAIINSMAIVGTLGILIRRFAYRLECDYPFIIKIAICIALMFVGPFDASRVLGRYYLGGYTGNIWHNPTYILVRLVGLMVFFLYTDILSKHEADLKQYITVSVLLTVSAFCKPNFYQSFLPGLVVVCVVYFLIHRNRKTFFECLKIAGTCVPVAVIALLQYILALSENSEGGVGVRFLYVWKHFTENWALSLIVSIIFPAFVYGVMAFRKKWNMQMVLSVSMLISAVVQYMFFYIAVEPFAGDFSWGLDLAIFYCFVTAAERVAEKNIMSGKILRSISIGCWVCFLVHLFFGNLFFINTW